MGGMLTCRCPQVIGGLLLMLLAIPIFTPTPIDESDFRAVSMAHNMGFEAVQATISNAVRTGRSLGGSLAASCATLLRLHSDFGSSATILRRATPNLSDEWPPPHKARSSAHTRR